MAKSKEANDLKKLHQFVIDQITLLSKRIRKEKDADLARAMLREQQELIHRSNLLGGLIFTATSKEVEKKVQGISAANDELAKAIRTAKLATEMVTAATAFLAVVDEVIDLAKVVA